jgi:hypothetical protein
VYRFTCTASGTRVDYEDERLHGYRSIVPIVLYALRNNTLNAELFSTFEAIKDEILSPSGVASKKNGLLFCDSFYYDVAKKSANIVISEKSLVISTVQAGYNAGTLQDMEIFNDLDTPDFTAFVQKKTKKAVKKETDTSFEEMKNGSAIIPYEWSEEQKLKIPNTKILDDFVPSAPYHSAVKKITARLNKVLTRMDAGIEGVEAIAKDYVNFFITGKPGTGKTTAAYALGAALGMPTYTVALSKNTEEDVFQGMTKVVEGNISFVSTDFLDAYKNGGIIILEEINLADPAVVMGAIGQAVESPFILLEDGFKSVRRHPLCVIIGTMNIGTYGSKGVNQALSSRFKQTYTLNDPEKSDFINILMKQGFKKKEASWVYGAYDKIINYLKSPSVNAEDIAINVTLRGCIGALENIEEGEDPREAIKNTLIGKIGEADLELANDVYNSVVLSLPEM